MKSLLSTSVSFESAIITCEIERGTRERRANKKFEGRHERRAFEGRAAGPRHGLVGDDSDEVVSGVQLIIAKTDYWDAEKIRISIHETEYTFGRRDDATGGEASTGAIFPDSAVACARSADVGLR